MAIAAVAIAAVAAGYQIYQGEKQKSEAKKIAARNKRPVKGINPATRELVAKTAFESGKFGMPGQGQLEASLDRTTAGSIRSLKDAGLSSAAMMAGFTGLDQNTKEVQERLNVGAADYKSRWTERHLQSLRGLAGEQEGVWDYNQRQKYDEAAAAASALTGAGNMNTNSGINAAATSAQNALLMNNYGAFDRNNAYNPSAPQKTKTYSQYNTGPYGLPNPPVDGGYSTSNYDFMGDSMYDMQLARQEMEAIWPGLSDEAFMQMYNTKYRPR